MVEEKNGEIYPVEYKKGQRGNWKNDQLQLCAQALCLEEMLGLSQPVSRGFLYYASTGNRKEIPFTEDLRTHTTHTIDAVRELLETQIRPEVRYGPRCRGCSLYPLCLPKEVEKLRANHEIHKSHENKEY